MQSPNHRGTTAAIAAVIVILIFGVWIINRLDASQKAQECAERGGRKCAIIDTDSLPRK